VELSHEEYMKYLDMHERGRWKGYGYFYSLNEELFHNPLVYYVSVDENIEVRSNPDLDP